MKKIIKALLFIVILNIVVGAGIISYITVSSFGPAFKESGITMKDLLKPRLDPDIKAQLEKAVSKSSSELGKKAADMIIAGLNKIIPSSEIDFSKINEAKYPYPLLDEVMEKTNKIASDAAAEGLKILEESEKLNDAVRKKALNDTKK